MAKVTLMTGSANITPWGQRCEGGVEFECADEAQLDFFRANPRYRVGDSVRPPARARRTAAVEAQPPASAVEPATEAPAPPKKDHSGLLDKSISALEKALATGEYDDVLDELRDAEEAGKTRKGAIQAINERADHLAQP